jgi:hypothetical protein
VRLGVGSPTSCRIRYSHSHLPRETSVWFFGGTSSMEVSILLILSCSSGLSWGHNSALPFPTGDFRDTIPFRYKSYYAYDPWNRPLMGRSRLAYNCGVIAPRTRILRCPWLILSMARSRFIFGRSTILRCNISVDAGSELRGST